ncbi:cellulose biosynthesis protein BcsN [Gellertiella hungarica]|uniref:Cellulose biosynthesis protein BcsN n=1 Tax=Gellertiella hungarica TaxID=1572859 RepID=A0A7W6NKA2_9HYPH|nr:cellulose biosynthesis protein BcsN [Gellertiella hungarica]MBB4064180.1 hypothetical protein [Gellertiella hungarica]
MNRTIIILGVIPVFLAGCNATVPDPFLTASTRPDAPTIASEVAPQFAVAALPVTAGGIRTVRQTARKDYLQQQIVYGNPDHGFGENAITVEVGRPDLDAAYLNPPSRRQIVAEMRAALPGVPMQIRSAYGENQQGPFGYATGPYRTAGSCLYGWQHVRPQTGNPLSAMAAGRHAYRLQVRVRFCHPSLPEGRIGTMMDGLRVKTVSADTLSMLEFASGSGEVASVPPLAAPAETPERAAPVRRRSAAPVEAYRPADLGDVVLPITRRQPPAGSLYVQGAGPTTIRHAARIPLPATGAPAAAPVGLPAVDATTTASGSRTPAAVAIPLPQSTLGSR